MLLDCPYEADDRRCGCGIMFDKRCSVGTFEVQVGDGEVGERQIFIA
jgi:hypothetical protein